MVTMTDIRDVVLQEIKQQFNPYKIQYMAWGDPNIELTAKPGFPAICLDFRDMVEIYRSADPDDLIKLDASDPDFLTALSKALDYFRIQRV